MSRLRKPDDPTRWPIACGRCGGHYQIVANWPDGGVCGYCYQQAKRTRGRCACGHQGVLPGRIDGHPACRTCSGVRLNIDCARCGAEDELYAGGHCWPCTLAETVDRLLTNPDTDIMAPQLVPIATALKTMNRADSGLTWIRQPHVTAFLTDLAREPAISHKMLDKLPASRTRDYVRGLLVEHGALPRRDELTARFQLWVEQALQRVSTDEHRDVVHRYIRWHHQRRMNGMPTVTEGTFLRAKQSVTVAIDLLNWLHDHGIQFADLDQAHLDAWQASGPTTREIASRFVRWAIKSHLLSPDLTMTPHRRGTSAKLPAAEQEQAIRQVAHTDSLTARDRAAAILVLVFGQQIQDVVQLTWRDVTADQAVTVRLAKTEMLLPPPLDRPWRELGSRRGTASTAAHPNSDWVFPGYSPGRHIQASSLRNRLRRHFGTRAARLGTLHELTKLAPAAIIAEVLGYHPATIERHATAASATYAEYIASVKQAPLPSTDARQA